MTGIAFKGATPAPERFQDLNDYSDYALVVQELNPVPQVINDYEAFSTPNEVDWGNDILDWMLNPEKVVEATFFDAALTTLAKIKTIAVNNSFNGNTGIINPTTMPIYSTNSTTTPAPSAANAPCTDCEKKAAALAISPWEAFNKLARPARLAGLGFVLLLVGLAFFAGKGAVK